MDNEERRNDLKDYLPEHAFINSFEIAISNPVYRDFLNCLRTAKNEKPLQVYLEKHPEILSTLLDGHLGKWVLPQKRLGSEYVADFVVGDLSSAGFRWIFVELESPRFRIFNKNGDPSAKLSHAIRQIMDWRSWISDNKAYAARKVSKGGLGLLGIRQQCMGLILIGRSDDLKDSDQERRKSLSEDLNIRIHTYDWLRRHLAYLSGNFNEID